MGPFAAGECHRSIETLGATRARSLGFSVVHPADGDYALR